MICINFRPFSIHHVHPSAWPTDHGWKVKKIVPRHIFVLDMFGGVKPVSVDEYLEVEL